MRLSDDDGRAVDFLLNPPTGDDSKGSATDVGGLAADASGQFTARLSAAEKVLSLLSHMPAAEPPANLLLKTLMKVSQSQALASDLETAADNSDTWVGDAIQ